MPEKTATARLFVAIWLPEQVRDHLGRALAEAIALTQPDPQLRPTRPETWHLTLAFLGDVAEQPALDRFASAGPLPEPDQLQVAGSGTFGSVAWVGVRHGPWLAAMAAQIQRHMRVADRRFQAHVTIARARRGPEREQRVAAGFAAALHSYESPPWLPDQIVLVQSHLGPHPTYPVRAQIPLSGGPNPGRNHGQAGRPVPA